MEVLSKSKHIIANIPLAEPTFSSSSTKKKNMAERPESTFNDNFISICNYINSLLIFDATFTDTGGNGQLVL